MFVWKLPKLQSLKIKFSSSSSLSLSLSCVKDANQTVHKKLRDKSALSTSTWLFKHSHLCLCSLQDGLLQFSYFWLPTVDYRKLRTLHETGFQSMRTWSCATSSASFSWVTGPSQNRWQTVNICHNFFSSSSPISLNSLCTPLPGSFILLQIHGYFVSPMVKLKPLVNAPLTVFQSDGMISLLTSITFIPPMPSKLPGVRDTQWDWDRLCTAPIRLRVPQWDWDRMCTMAIVSHSESEIGSGLLYDTRTECVSGPLCPTQIGSGLLHNKTGTECVPCPLCPTLSQAWG